MDYRSRSRLSSTTTTTTTTQNVFQKPMDPIVTRQKWDVLIILSQWEKRNVSGPWRVPLSLEASRKGA